MIDKRLLQELGIDPEKGYIDQQFRDLGFEDLGEGNGWRQGHPNWERTKGTREVYSTCHGYHLYADPEAKIIFHTHSGD